MADLFIRAKWMGDPAKRGIQELKAETQSLGSVLGTIKTIGLGALGIGGVLGAVQKVQNAFRGVVEEATIFGRLTDTIARRGGASLATIGAMNREIDRLSSTGSSLEDSRIATALDIITETSGNAAEAVNRLSFAIDLSIAKRIELERAAKITGFIIKGEIDQAARFAPEIKELSRDFGDLKGTLDLSNKAFEALGGVLGAAEAQMDQAQGKIDRFNRGIGELGENLFKAASGGTGFLDFVGELGDKLNRIAQIVGSGASDGASVGGILGGPVGKILEAYLRGSAPSMPFGGGAFRGAGARQNIPPMMFQGGADNPFILPGTTVTASRQDQKYVDPLEAYRESILGRRAQMFADSGAGMRAGGVRGRQGSILPFGDKMESENHPRKLIEEWKRDQQEFGSLLSSTISSAFATGARDGGKAMIEELKNNFVDQLFSLLGNGIAMSLFPGFAPSGIAGAILGGKGGASSGTVSSANARARSIQQARMAAARG